MKKLLSLVLAMVLALSMSGIAFAEETVNLLVWVGDDADQPWINGVIEKFKAAYPEANFEFQIGIISEADCKGVVLTDPEAAADVYTFAHDQIIELVDAGALQEVAIDTEEIIAANGGLESGAVKAAMRDGTLYAYPATADNGYFMFYNKDYFTEEDVASLDKMMEIASANGKYVSYDLDAAWYLFAFFAGAGLEVYINPDNSNTCNWNATDTPIKGIDVAEALTAIAANNGIINQTDAEFTAGIKDGSVIAGVNGVWNANVAKEAWGESYAACKLPTYTVKGEQVQMGSFAGYKLVGVNAYSPNVYYAMLFAEYMTNYESQMSRFEIRNQGPSNVEAAASDIVMADPAIAALAAQAAFATAQNVGGNYWGSADTFGAIIYSGNPDNTPLQELLDNMVTGITAPIV